MGGVVGLFFLLVDPGAGERPYVGGRLPRGVSGTRKFSFCWSRDESENKASGMEGRV